MAYPTPKGIGEAAVGSGMAGIQFMLAVRMELLKEYEEASRACMSEVKLWCTLAVKSFNERVCPYRGPMSPVAASVSFAACSVADFATCAFRFLRQPSRPKPPRS